MQFIQLGAALIFAAVLGLSAAGAGSKGAAPLPLLKDHRVLVSCAVEPGAGCQDTKSLVLAQPYVYCRHEILGARGHVSTRIGYHLTMSGPSSLQHRIWVEGTQDAAEASPRIYAQELRVMGIKAYAGADVRRAMGCSETLPVPHPSGRVAEPQTLPGSENAGAAASQGDA